ncbi:MAG: DUF4426 domain-containing protein [Wenzhouxiangellaceae bacterium]|nr:DUF4426 domain-containing protein [Wenzhouxiangellaceae bacterium]MBS3823863.1 DUF4426 domain-containing protein [Wenzhouxiangellaceae bacterium]
MRSFKVMALLMLAGALAAPAAAQQSEQFGDYEVHYNTLNTNQLSPDVASVYGIQRAGTQAMLNITVLDQETREPVEAEVSATATNLTGQRRDIDLRQINDQGAIYYIGQFRIHDEESLNFSVQIQPESHDGSPFTLTFRQKFFTG